MIANLAKASIISSDKQKIEMQEILYKNVLFNSVEYLYWLDLEGRLLTCNQMQANFFKTNIDEIVGKNVLEIGVKLGWRRQDLELVQNNNCDVLKTGKPKVIEELLEEKENTRIILSCKNPLINEAGELIGVFGTSMDITKYYEGAIFSQLMFSKTISNLIISNKAFSEKINKRKSFTFRESQCAAYLLTGKTTKQIAKELNLSPRTVEEYIANMKGKFRCRTRSELIEVIITLMWQKNKKPNS